MKKEKWINEIWFRAKHMHALDKNEHLDGEWMEGYISDIDYINSDRGEFLIDKDTICMLSGMKDKNKKLIWQDDILMCHGNPSDLVIAKYGEFDVINAETETVVDRVIGWHYEVIPTDAISKIKPFCYSMPLTPEYIEHCEMRVVGNVYDNPELLKEENEK